MTSIPRDNNSIPVGLAVLDTDGTTLKSIRGSAAHVLQVHDATTGTDQGPTRAERDENQVTGLCSTDSTGAIIPLYVNSSGELLIDSV